VSDRAFIEVLFSDGISYETWSNISDELAQKTIGLLNDHIGSSDGEVGLDPKRPTPPPPENPEYYTCPNCDALIDPVDIELQGLRRLALEAAAALQRYGENDISTRIYAAFRGRQS
jgi:hypothetical protein